ncbi:uncharacterized protein [Gossypium hirsutum]|uniref:Reverse transcriptase/retrotransposon-derived protein RNase H-like domain-containing protein n=1 Tax=Gossypium hirsutum TaxID=3635 RepID=A0A1U8IYV0_GOSHI|nr:uncharacterized protein LOC107899891 [Gossypium hirsutum]
MDKDIEVPLILGLPFLVTTRAIIDKGNGKLVVREIVYKDTLELCIVRGEKVDEDNFVSSEMRINLDANESSLRQKEFETIEVVPEKGRMTIVANEKNELIPTRTVTSQECLEAFNVLKEKLINALVMVAPDWNLPFELMCDVSDFIVVAVLRQQRDKHFQPIYYASKTLTDAQENYTTTEKELLVVIRDKKGDENLVENHLSRLENPHIEKLDDMINDWFLEERLYVVNESEVPWFADIANYLVSNILPKGLSH